MTAAARPLATDHSVNGVAPTSQSHPSLVERLEFYENCADAEADWRRLESGDALVSPYQRFHWSRLWQDHVGELSGARPLIVVGRDSAGAPVAVLPFVRTRLGPMTVARFFGGKHANINLGLWRRDIAATLTADAVRTMLAETAGRFGIDLYKLINIPTLWDGMRSALLLLSNERASDDILELDTRGLDGTALVTTQVSSTMRGRLRTKERKLTKLDGYRYFRAQTAEDVDRLMNAFMAQKATHFAAAGLSNVFAEPGVEAFLRAAAMPDGATAPSIEIHALEGGGEVLALFAGVCDGVRYSSMFNSYTASEHARHSPGLIILTHMLKDIGDRRVRYFDLGVGEARYKSFFCDATLALHHCYLPFSPIGRLAVLADRPVNSVKRAIKSSPAAWNAVKKMRQRFAGRPVETASE